MFKLQIKSTMTELEKFKLVNSCDTVEDLKLAIIELADKKTGLIQGRTRTFDAEKMSSYVDGVVSGDLSPNLLTREFGIRQQGLYLRYYLS